VEDGVSLRRADKGNERMSGRTAKQGGTEPIREKYKNGFTLFVCRQKHCLPQLDASVLLWYKTFVHIIGTELKPLDEIQAHMAISPYCFRRRYE